MFELEFLFEELNGLANGKAQNWVKLDWGRIQRHGRSYKKLSLLMSDISINR